MLRKHDNVRLHFSPDLFTGMGWVTMQVGTRSAYRLEKLHKKQWGEGQEFQRAYPLRITELMSRTYWLFQDEFWSTEDQNLDAGSVHAMLLLRAKREEEAREAANAQPELSPPPAPTLRTIPGLASLTEDVKEAVWLRDRGACCNCGETAGLEFDHVIPAAMGGPSSEANVQLLCNPCHRIKGAARAAHGGVRRRRPVPFEG